MELFRFDHQIAGLHSPLQERAIKEALLIFYQCLGAQKEDHFIFTSSAAEGINHAVFAAYLDITRKTGKNHFLCSALSEASAIMSMSRLEELGCVFQMIPANSGCTITENALIEMITPRTAMVSVSWANGLTGVIQPLAPIAKICRERAILLHVDATHTLGKGEFSFAASEADVLTFGTPFGGMGGMFIRKDIEMSPLILGGHEQGNMRGGPISNAGLIECAKWLKQEQACADHYCIEIARLKSIFEEKLSSSHLGVDVLFQNQARVPHITSCLFPQMSSDALCFALDQKGVKTTHGGNHLQQFVHILKACGFSEPSCHSGLSFGFSHTTTEEEIEKGTDILIETVKSMRKYSEHLTLGHS